MFKQRLLTVLSLGPLVILAICYANPWLLAIAAILLTLGGGMEWTQLVPLNKPYQKIIFMLVLFGLIILAPVWLDFWLLVGLLAWLCILGMVVTFPKNQAVWGHAWVVALLCFIILPLFIACLSKIFAYTQGRSLILYIISLIWAADIGAYLAGKQVGKHKLIPEVSPGKTVEGTLGGFWFAMMIAVVGYVYFQPHSIFLWYVTAALTIFISVLGDLSISVLKRRCKVKDTGNIFPGHGGLLDRMDSLIAAVPFFYGGLLLMRWA